MSDYRLTVVIHICFAVMVSPWVLQYIPYIPYHDRDGVKENGDTEHNPQLMPVQIDNHQ